MQVLTSFFKRNWIHFAAIGLFFIIGAFYFNLQLEGYGLKQHDIEEHKGMSHEIADFREHNDGAEPLWTNSMFGGMPAMQISTIYSGNLFASAITSFLTTFPSPMGIVLLYLICFYAGLCMLKINKWVAIIGAIGFAFSSYELIMLQAGHNSKGVAVAFMAPVVGAFIMAFRRNWILGASLSGVFMAFEMAANHLQVTYYLGFVLLALGIVELFNAIKSKQYVPFFKATGGILFGYLLAFFVNYGNIMLTADYASETIRGGNDVTESPDGKSIAANTTKGLDRDYVTTWSYGKGESFTLLSPYVKGSSTTPFADTPFADKVDELEVTPEVRERVLGYPVYWGEQPGTSGPVYVGVILIFLALLGMVYIKDRMKWALLAATILTLCLSWGKNFMGLTNFFLDNVPGYDKFRAVTIILVIVELCVPILAILFLDKLIKEREEIKVNIKPFYYTSGAFLLVLFILKFGGIDSTYQSQQMDANQRIRQEEGMRQQLTQADPAQIKTQYGVDVSNPAQLDGFIQQNMQSFDETLAGVVEARKAVFQSSMNRSILFAIFAGLILLALFKSSLSSYLCLAGLGLLITIDMMGVARVYLNNDEEGSGYKHWSEILEKNYPMKADVGDIQILDSEMAASPKVKAAVEKGKREGEAKANELEAVGAVRTRIIESYSFSALNRATNYRVLDFSGGFTSARCSYFHKAMGGYHGAKLRSTQNLIEFHLGKSNNKVMDMMNVKYFLQPSQSGELAASPNPTAMGNAWFVRKVEVAETPTDEIKALGSRFELANKGAGQLVVNGFVQKSAAVYGSEKIQYVMAGKDSMNVPLSNGIPEGLKALFVMDAKGATNLIPESTLLADTANSFQQLVELKVTNEFKPREEAIIRKEEASKLSAKNYKGEGEIKMLSYAPNKLKYNVKASDKGLVVFSEVYYNEGWTATIDGKPADILRVNYILRGLEIPKGNHKVEFTFDLPKFHQSNLFGWFGSLILLGMVIGAGCLGCKKEKI